MPPGPEPLAPRKRPRQARAQATCTAILDGAAQILGARGLAGFNTNAVAERAGVSIGTLYQYFGNKDSLMAALIRREQAERIDALEHAAAAARGATLAETVRSLVRAAMQSHRDHPLLAAVIDHEEARLPIAAELDAALARSGTLVRAVLEHHREEVGALDLDRASRTLPALVRAVVDAWANLSPPQLDHAEEEAVRAALGYLNTARPVVD